MRDDDRIITFPSFGKTDGWTEQHEHEYRARLADFEGFPASKFWAVPTGNSWYCRHDNGFMICAYPTGVAAFKKYLRLLLPSKVGVDRESSMWYSLLHQKPNSDAHLQGNTIFTRYFDFSISSMKQLVENEYAFQVANEIRRQIQDEIDKREAERQAAIPTREMLAASVDALLATVRTIEAKLKVLETKAHAAEAKAQATEARLQFERVLKELTHKQYADVLVTIAQLKRGAKAKRLGYHRVLDEMKQRGFDTVVLKITAARKQTMAAEIHEQLLQLQLRAREAGILLPPVAMPMVVTISQPIGDTGSITTQSFDDVPMATLVPPPKHC